MKHAPIGNLALETFSWNKEERVESYSVQRLEIRLKRKIDVEVLDCINMSSFTTEDVSEGVNGRRLADVFY